MKLCNSEIIKKIKVLEEKKCRILGEEETNRTTTYQKEFDIIDLGYDFNETRKAVEEINREVIKLKHALNVVNATVNVPEFDMTIGECIVYMAQLNAEKRVIEPMSMIPAKKSSTTYGGAVEYTIANYDIDECKQKLSDVNETICKLQVSIDRMNLSHTIEV